MPKTYYVTVRAEISCTVTVTAKNAKAAATQAQKIAEEETEITWGTSCESPDTYWFPVQADQIEEA
jgi:hypothetical protein